MKLSEFTRMVVDRCTQTQAELFACMDWSKTNEEGYTHGHKDNGASVLAVAHTDYVVYDKPRVTGQRVHAGQLDDRLGCAIIMDLLPRLGIPVDVLLTDAEEIGQSTAADFSPEKTYNWIVEFDRRGTSVVSYEYQDDTLDSLLESVGFATDWGSFSDICRLDHLGVKGFNVGVDYHGEHTSNCYADLLNTWEHVCKFVKFYRKFSDIKLNHSGSTTRSRYGRYGGYSGGYSGGGGWQDDDDFVYRNAVSSFSHSFQDDTTTTFRCVCCGLDTDSDEACDPPNQDICQECWNSFQQIDED